MHEMIMCRLIPQFSLGDVKYQKVRGQRPEASEAVWVLALSTQCSFSHQINTFVAVWLNLEMFEH